MYALLILHIIGEDGLLDVARKTFLQCVEDIYALGEAYARYIHMCYRYVLCMSILYSRLDFACVHVTYLCRVCTYV